jgi:hypothetical protein
MAAWWSCSGIPSPAVPVGVVYPSGTTASNRSNSRLPCSYRGPERAVASCWGLPGASVGQDGSVFCPGSGIADGVARFAAPVGDGTADGCPATSQAGPVPAPPANHC